MRKVKDAALCAVFGTPLFGIALVMFIAAVVPSANTLWTQGITVLKVTCQGNVMMMASLNCSNAVSIERAFTAGMHPFFPTMVFSGTRLVTQVEWNSFNSRDFCSPATRLYQDYASPSGLCNDNQEFVMPAAANTAQAMIIMSIIFAFLTILTQVGTLLSQGNLACLISQYVASIITLFFACIVVSTWNNFSIPNNLRTGMATTMPIWNASVEYRGTVAVKTKYSYRLEDVFELGWSDQLVGLPTFHSVGQGPGYNLFIAGLSFVVIGMLFVLPTCCMLCSRSADGDEGSFGLGSQSNLPSGFTPLGEAGSRADDVPRPAGPPPPLPQTAEADFPYKKGM